MWVSPFRYPRIKGYLLLPVAFRSLSRLSSALSAKASTLRSFQLNLLIRVRVCSLIYVRSVGRLGLGSFNVFTKFILLHCFNFDNNNLSFYGKNVYVLRKTTQLFFTSFWMSLSFNSLRFVFGFQGTYFLVSSYSQWDSQNFVLLRHVLRTMFHPNSHRLQASLMRRLLC